eukprot:s288_g25.t1
MNRKLKHSVRFLAKPCFQNAKLFPSIGVKLERRFSTDTYSDLCVVCRDRTQQVSICQVPNFACLLIAFAMPLAKRQRVSGRCEPIAFDHYGALGVGREATQREITLAYHRKALETHPDRPTGKKDGKMDENFQPVALAYEVLSDEAKRQAYNMSLVGSSSSDGINPSRGRPRGVDAHLLADHPEAMIRILLSADPSLWGRLLKGMNSNHRQRLLDGLQSLEASGRGRKKSKGVENTAEAFGDCADLECMCRVQSRYYAAKTTLHCLAIMAPTTPSKVVAVFYHSSMVELKRLIELCIKEKPCVSFEEAVVSSLRRLDNEGLTCPFKFHVHIGRRGKHGSVQHLLSPCVGSVSLALRMRKEVLTSDHNFAKLKEKWQRQAQNYEERAVQMRPKLVSRLVGFLLAQQDAERCAPVARVRRCLKQEADVVLKVPILKKVCDALQQPAWQLERELASGDGQKALMEFLAQRKALRDVPKTKWMEMPPAAWALVLSFNGITDLAAAMSVDRARCQHARASLQARCDGMLILLPEDFGESEQPVFRFLCTEYVRQVRCIDLRHMPEDVTNASLLWAVMRRKADLVRVILHHSTPPPPCDPALPFSVEISLQD